MLEQSCRDRYYSKLGLSTPSFPQSAISPKSHQQHRIGYLMKLQTMGLIRETPSKKHQTIMIYDWDDTLLCTSVVRGYGQSLPEDIHRRLQQMQNLLKILSKSLGYAKVFIVTNAASGWVEYSSLRYLPKIYEYILKNKIEVISARSLFEDEYPGDYLRWKVEAFKLIKKQFDWHVMTNLICIGDSIMEIQAAQILGQEFRLALVKTIKLCERPKIQQLLKQQELVYSQLQEIYINTGSLTIKMQKKQLRC